MLSFDVIVFIGTFKYKLGWNLETSFISWVYLRVDRDLVFFQGDSFLQQQLYWTLHYIKSCTITFSIEKSKNPKFYEENNFFDTIFFVAFGTFSHMASFSNSSRI